MTNPYQVLGRLGCVLVVAAACSDDGLTPEATGPSDDPPDVSLVDSVFSLTELPGRLSELDLSQAAGFTPKWALWSNGLEKERRIQLPTGARVDISNPAVWRFPEGALLLKDFAVRQTDGSLRNVETRILWRHDEKWTGAVYLWEEDQSDAVLSAGLARGEVEVTNRSGHTFDHGVPSRADCVTCHGASPQFVLGFGELQLNWLADGVEQLPRLQGLDLFAQSVRSDPDEIVSDDTEKAWVMGYLTGNCVHCHDGTKRFDLSYQSFDDQVVGIADPTGAVLITPGSAEESSVYTLLNEGLMPPLGVQVPDSVSIERLKVWIDGLGR